MREKEKNTHTHKSKQIELKSHSKIIISTTPWNKCRPANNQIVLSKGTLFDPLLFVAAIFTSKAIHQENQETKTQEQPHRSWGRLSHLSHPCSQTENKLKPGKWGIYRFTADFWIRKTIIDLPIWWKPKSKLISVLWGFLFWKSKRKQHDVQCFFLAQT